MTETQDSTHILGLLISFGMTPIGQDCPCPIKECYKVILDGKILGYIPDEVAKKVVDKMRLMKIKNDKVSRYYQ